MAASTATGRRRGHLGSLLASLAMVFFLTLSQPRASSADPAGGGAGNNSNPAGNNPTGSNQPTTCPDEFRYQHICNVNGQGCTWKYGRFTRSNSFTKEHGSTNVEMEDCCALCASDSNCAYWTWTKNDNPNGKNDCQFYSDSAMCALGQESWQPIGTGHKSGGNCNPGAHDDPHFVGAEGTHFDFGGVPQGDFCLVSDRRLHINMHLSGYYELDENMRNVTRTWIRGLGIRFDSHTIVLEARSDGNPDRLDGYMKSIVVDGEEVRMNPGSSKRVDGAGIELRQAAVSHDEGFEQDNFELTIDGVLQLALRLRSAGKRWQTPEDAETHINLRFGSLSHSEDVHGVLGQTYRTATDKSKHFRMTVGYQGNMQVEGPNGDGFLDGTMEDYRVSGILATDCKFARFGAADSSEMDGDVNGPTTTTTSTRRASYSVSALRRRRRAQ